MVLRERILGARLSLVAALLLVAAFAAPVLAEIGDADGLDGDELVLPLLLGAVAVVGIAAVIRGRRPSSRR